MPDSLLIPLPARPRARIAARIAGLGVLLVLALLAGPASAQQTPPSAAQPAAVPTAPQRRHARPVRHHARAKASKPRHAPARAATSARAGAPSHAAGPRPAPLAPVSAVPLPPPVALVSMAEAPFDALPALINPADIASADTLPAITPPSITPASTEDRMCVENATIAELRAALAAGQTTATALVRAYLARIDAYDRAGPTLNAVREINPDALAIAARLDAGPHDTNLPLAGIPILLKDNIATADNEHTSAGSLALADAFARRDATVAAKLRRAGAIILGKANMTEFANMLAIGMPAGYSSLGGQVRNAYAPVLDDKGLTPVSPGGSSSGSAVAVAAGLAAASIGTETSGSLLSPASRNGLVTVKPTVGLISRAGIIPIAASQDTAGPITRTVRDAAILLNVLAGRDPLDPATLHAPKPPDYLKALDKDGLRGARIGVPSDPADPANDVYYRHLSPRSTAVMDAAIKLMADHGAQIVRANIATEGWIGGPGTDMAILNRNPLSPDVNGVARYSIVLIYELKHDMNLYLRDWAKGTAMHTLSDIIGFNAAHADRALRFGQDLFLAADSTRGDLREAEYRSARQMDLRAARDAGLDAYMEENRLDAVLFPGAAGASIAAKAGYPSVQVPAGFTAGVNGKPSPDYPIGVTFTGRAWSEATLLRIAYAFEQASLARRRMPPGLPPLDAACGK
jgi:amidase